MASGHTYTQTAATGYGQPQYQYTSTYSGYTTAQTNAHTYGQPQYQYASSYSSGSSNQSYGTAQQQQALSTGQAYYSTPRPKRGEPAVVTYGGKTTDSETSSDAQKSGYWK